MLPRASRAPGAPRSLSVPVLPQVPVDAVTFSGSAAQIPTELCWDAWDALAATHGIAISVPQHTSRDVHLCRLVRWRELCSSRQKRN